MRIKSALAATTVALALLGTGATSASWWGDKGWGPGGGDWMPWGNNSPWGKSSPWDRGGNPWDRGGNPWNNGPWNGDGWDFNSRSGPWSKGPWGDGDGFNWGSGRNNPWDMGPWGNDRWKGKRAPWNKDFPWQDERAFRGWGPVPKEPLRRPPAPPTYYQVPPPGYQGQPPRGAGPAPVPPAPAGN